MFWALTQTQLTDFPTHLYILLVKSLPFHIPEAWKRYPFRTEPPRIGHHRYSNCIKYYTDITPREDKALFSLVLHCIENKSSVIKGTLKIGGH